MDPDEVAHNEPPYLDLHCLQNLLLSVLVLEILKGLNYQPKDFSVYNQQKFRLNCICQDLFGKKGK